MNSIMTTLRSQFHTYHNPQVNDICLFLRSTYLFYGYRLVC